MSKVKIIRVYDYVNHPYQEVRDVLSEDALTVFRNATKVAAERAQTVASELHIKVAGIEVSTDIEVTVAEVEEKPKKEMSSPVTHIRLEWAAAKLPRLFPFMKAELSVYPLTATETQLDLLGNYEPPFGVIGSAIDAVVGHRIAEASVHQFVRDIAAYLRKEMS